jgi:hypothetical protein
MSKVFWTPEEHALVAAAAYKAMIEMNLRPLAAIRYAQRVVLTPNRQRPDSALATTGNVKDVIKVMDKLRHADLVNEVLQMTSKNPEPASQPGPDKPSSLVAQALETFLDRLVTEIEQRISRQIACAEKRRRDELQQLAETMKHELPKQIIAANHHDKEGNHGGSSSSSGGDGGEQGGERSRSDERGLRRSGHGIKSMLPRFVIVGLKGAQATRLEKDFHNKVRLKFVPASIPTRVLRDNAVGAEKVFLMTKFINHAHSDIVDKDKRVLVDGGVSALEKMIRETFAH